MNLIFLAPLTEFLKLKFPLNLFLVLSIIHPVAGGAFQTN